MCQVLPQEMRHLFLKRVVWRDKARPWHSTDRFVKPPDRAAEMGSYDGSPKMFVFRLARSWDFDFHLFGQFWCGPKHDKSRKSRAWGMPPKTSSITRQSCWKGPFSWNHKTTWFFACFLLANIEDASYRSNNVQHPFPTSSELIFPITRSLLLEEGEITQSSTVSRHHLPVQRNFTVFPCPATSVAHFHKPVLGPDVPTLEAYSQLYRCPESHSVTGPVHLVCHALQHFVSETWEFWCSVLLLRP